MAKKETSPVKPETLIRELYLDKDGLAELGLNKDRIDDSASVMLEQYCILQKLRRGESIPELTIDQRELAEREK